MNFVRLLALAGLAFGVTAVTSTAKAQGPLYDKVIVDLPYSVTINNTTLQPGHYVIRQFDDPTGDSRILQIFGDRGMKLEATAQTIPTLDNNTPDKTSIILHHYGNDYYFDKIWVQGKNYGYEFPLPPSVKARQKERMEPYTVAAQYQAVPKTEEAQSTPPPAPEPAPTPVAAAPEPAAAREAAPAPAPETNQMPTTAGSWTMQIVGGMLLLGAGAGVLLRRRVA